jgi:glycosyltransferase involved in cell wall biosynthesis
MTPAGRPDTGDLGGTHESSLLPYHLGLLAAGSPDDVTTWSGIPFSMQRALQGRFAAVTYLPAAPVGVARLGYERARRAGARLLGRRSLPGLDPRELRRRCAPIEHRLRTEPVDALFAITVDQLVAVLETDLPVIHHSDATFEGLEDYYERHSALLPRSRRLGHDVARRAIQRSTLNIYPSEWAARSAVETYGADPTTTFAVPYGANFDDPPTRAEALAAVPRDTCKLLFVGVDWGRKGGPMVVDTLLELRRRGIDTELTVVGTDPGTVPDGVQVFPFLNKQQRQQRLLLRDLWLSSSFFFMPSRAEAFGVVYAEAAAHGLPVIATDTGGVGAATVDRTTGRLLHLGATPVDYADAIEEIWRDPETYATYVTAARDRFESDLNWDVWADRVAGLVAGALEGRLERR